MKWLVFSFKFDGIIYWMSWRFTDLQANGGFTVVD